MAAETRRLSVTILDLTVIRPGTPAKFSAEAVYDETAGEADVGLARSSQAQRTSLPTIMAELILASWETVTRRALLIAENKCSLAEYSRMLDEKAEAAAASGLAFISSGGRATTGSVLAPWHRRAVANARRLRKQTRLLKT